MRIINIHSFIQPITTKKLLPPNRSGVTFHFYMRCGWEGGSVVFSYLIVLDFHGVKAFKEKEYRDNIFGKRIITTVCFAHTGNNPSTKVTY